LRTILDNISARLPAIRQAATLVYKSSAKWTVLSAVLVIIQGVFPLLTLYLTKLIIDAATAGINAADKTAAFTTVIKYVLYAAAAGILSHLLTGLAQLVQEYRDLQVGLYIQSMIQSKSIQVDLEYYENPAYFDTLHMAQNQAMHRPTAMVNKLVQVAQNSITLGAMMAVLFTFDVVIILLVAVTVLPAIYVKFRFSRRLFDWYKKWTITERRSQYYSWLITAQYYAKELRLYNLGELFSNRFRDLHWRAAMDRLKLSRKRNLAELASQIFVVAVVFGLLGFMAWRAVAGAITLGGLVMYYQAFQRGQSSLQSSMSGLADLYEDSLFLRSMFEFLELPVRIADPPKPRPLSPRRRHRIGFEDVSFQYPATDRFAIQDVSFEIDPGEHVALVGENGSGKSTLIKLLCRLYDPKAGRITLDGADLREYAVGDLRRTMGVMLQDFSQYQTTGRENIWYGDIALPEQDPRILSAARMTGADEVLARLSKGFDTPLGKWFDQGEELSVGEWQKVALARVFVRDAPVVVLDEPTSALDARAEYRIFELFKSLAKNRTAIFISHRLSSARVADRVLVLDQGRLVEQGSHTSLMRKKGLYAKMFNLQARNYR